MQDNLNQGDFGSEVFFSTKNSNAGTIFAMELFSRKILTEIVTTSLFLQQKILLGLYVQTMDQNEIEPSPMRQKM